MNFSGIPSFASRKEVKVPGICHQCIKEWSLLYSSHTHVHKHTLTSHTVKVRWKCAVQDRRNKMKACFLLVLPASTYQGLDVKIKWRNSVRPWLWHLYPICVKQVGGTQDTGVTQSGPEESREARAEIGVVLLPSGLCHGHPGGLWLRRMWDQALRLAQASRKAASTWYCPGIDPSHRLSL